MSLLRMALPPLADLQANSEVTFAWLERNGQVREEGRCTLAQLGQRAKLPALEAYLHPQDSVLASLELPPLPAAKVTAAVQCAVAGLILGAPAQMFIAHGRRDDHGRVALAWLPRDALARLGALLRQCGLTLRGLFPAAYALPTVASGASVACRWDGYLLLRHSLLHAEVYPEAADADLLTLAGPDVQWLGDGAPQGLPAGLPSQQRWAGPAPGWGLHAGVLGRGHAAQGWGKALACCALAVAVWALGLNLYAAREAARGQQLKAQIHQRVKQAFPELPVILNPLQQARQQLAARQSGVAGEAGFTPLIQHAATAMPFIAASVQELVFENGELQLTLLADSRKPADHAWQATLAEAGIQASASDAGWTLRPMAAAPTPDAPKEVDDE